MTTDMRRMLSVIGVLLVSDFPQNLDSIDVGIFRPTHLSINSIHRFEQLMRMGRARHYNGNCERGP